MMEKPRTEKYQICPQGAVCREGPGCDIIVCRGLYIGNRCGICIVKAEDAEQNPDCGRRGEPANGTELLWASKRVCVHSVHEATARVRVLCLTAALMGCLFHTVSPLF
ncbi:MAG: hypothetical protein E7604_09880 [Ruminococcaceae bacterium]|nr:hypothetical protein [Oscillospiraceae bacterium]